MCKSVGGGGGGGGKQRYMVIIFDIINMSESIKQLGYQFAY